MARETAAQKKTRISMLLAEYDARNRELAKLNAIVKGLKEQIREIDAGTYNEFTLVYGQPRMIMDQRAAKQALEKAGMDVPMTETQPAINVIPVAGK